jgi:hypothetical protein
MAKIARKLHQFINVFFIVTVLFHFECEIVHSYLVL